MDVGGGVILSLGGDLNDTWATLLRDEGNKDTFGDHDSGVWKLWGIYEGIHSGLTSFEHISGW